MNKVKTISAFRISDEGRALLQAVADSLGINQTSAVEIAIRKFVRSEGIDESKVLEQLREELSKQPRKEPTQKSLDGLAEHVVRFANVVKRNGGEVKPESLDGLLNHAEKTIERHQTVSQEPEP